MKALLLFLFAVQAHAADVLVCQNLADANGAPHNSDMRAKWDFAQGAFQVTGKVFGNEFAAVLVDDKTVGSKKVERRFCLRKVETNSRPNYGYLSIVENYDCTAYQEVPSFVTISYDFQTRKGSYRETTPSGTLSLLQFGDCQL